MNAILPILPISSTSKVRYAIRRLRWFRKTFREQARQMEKLAGIAFETDDAKLTGAFVAWLRAFEVNRQGVDDANRKDFVYFLAGVMLAELLRARPVIAGPLPAEADPELPLYFWPEGYICTSYCLSVCLAVIEQDYGEEIALDESLFDLRSWQSFRENAAENPTLAIAFLDQFVGNEPNWTFPGFPEARANRARPQLSGKA